MISLIRLVVSVAVTVLVLGGCSFNLPKAEESKAIPVATIKPELDYSSEAPTCEVAAQRLSDNIQVGMTLAEVRRLVGKPHLIVPGRWYYADTFGEGRPVVSYRFGSANDNVQVTSFESEATGC